MAEIAVVVVAFAACYLTVLSYILWIWRRSRPHRGDQGR